MRNASVVSRRCGARPRLASPAALLLLLPLAMAAFGVQAQAVPETALETAATPADTAAAGQADAVPDVAQDAVASADVPSAQVTVVEAAAELSDAAPAPDGTAPEGLEDVAVAVQADAPAAAEQVAVVAEQAAAGAEPAAPAVLAPPVAEQAVEASAPAVAEGSAAAAAVDTAAVAASPAVAPAVAEQAVAADAPVPAVTATEAVATNVAAPAETPVAAEQPAAAEQTAAVVEVAEPTASAAAAVVAAPVAAPQVVEPVPAPAPAVVPDAAAVAASAPAPKPPALVNENNAIERQLGARCPNDLAARMANQGELLIGACQGTMPAHLAAVLVAIPEQQIHLPRAWRERQVAQRSWFKAVPGQGVRPDFLAVQGDIWVRSFEGADPATTVYLVSAPFDCADGRMLEIGAAEPERLPAGSCRQAFVQERVYRVSAGAAPVDITAEVMPARPALSEAEKKRYEARGGRVVLDHSKLQFGPAMRWHVNFDGAGEVTEARGYGDWGRVHLGFVAWDGQRFVQRDTLPRSQWPCDPVAPGDRQCGGFADAGRDPFVVADAQLQSQGATP